MSRQKRSSDTEPRICGRTSLMPTKPRSVDRQTRRSQRFWVQARVDGSCWTWTGPLRSNGYGEAREIVGARTRYAHRAAYQLVKGPIPTDMELDHTCRNRACINPAHLEPVTTRENLLRSGLTRAGRNARKTACIRGHAFTPENTLIVPRGRQCRECRRLRRQLAKGVGE